MFRRAERRVSRTLKNRFRCPGWLRLTDQLETAQPTASWAKVLNEYPHFAVSSLTALDHYRIFVNADATDINQGAALIPGRRAHEFPKLLLRVRHGDELLYTTIAPSVGDHEGTQALTSAKLGLRDLDRVYKQIALGGVLHARNVPSAKRGGYGVGPVFLCARQCAVWERSPDANRLPTLLARALAQAGNKS